MFRVGVIDVPTIGNKNHTIGLADVALGKVSSEKHIVVRDYIAGVLDVLSVIAIYSFVINTEAEVQVKGYALPCKVRDGIVSNLFA